MDLNSKLFFLDANSKSISGYSYLNSSLNSLLEHKTFSLKSRGELQAVISSINLKLDSQADRANGLKLLKVFLPQCSDDVFADNCVSWMLYCNRMCTSSSEKENVSLAYETLRMLLGYSGIVQELTKPVSSSVIPKFLEQVQRISSNFSNLKENHTSLLRCIESAIRNYGGACTSHKNNLEKFLMKFLDHPDEQTAYLAARCVAVLPLVGGGGISNINHVTAWKALQEKLISHAHVTLDSIFEGIPEIQIYQNIEKISVDAFEDLLSEESNPVIRIQRLSTILINLTSFLKELLLHELPVAKRVMPTHFIKLLIRGFAVNSNTVSKHITADKLIVGCLIPHIHSALFSLLDALILCCGQNLLEYGSIICRLVSQTLKWTAYDKSWPHGSERPYINLRKRACDTLILWLQVAKGGSCLEISSPDELIELLLSDVKIRHTTVTLSGARTRGRHMTKQQRKQLKQGQSNVPSPSESPWTRSKLYDETANSLICSAALKALQWIVQAVGSFLKPSLHKQIQDTVVKILLKVTCGEISAPYGDWSCRMELYQLLHSLVVFPHTCWPPPLQFALQLFRMGQLDKVHKVASFCHQSLNTLIKIVHTVSAPLLFAPSLMDMQKVIQSEENNCGNIVFESDNMDVEVEHRLRTEVDDSMYQTSTDPIDEINCSVNQHNENSKLNTSSRVEESELEVEMKSDKPSASEEHSNKEILRDCVIAEAQDSQIQYEKSNNISSSQPSGSNADKVCNKVIESNTSELQVISSNSSGESNVNNILALQEDSNVCKGNIILESDDKNELYDVLDKSDSSDESFEKCIISNSEDEEEFRNNEENKGIGRCKLFPPLPSKFINKCKNPTIKQPSSPNNYSISYLYDQSSDSCESGSEPITDEIESPTKHRTIDQSEISEDSFALDIDISTNENPENKQDTEKFIATDVNEKHDQPEILVEDENSVMDNNVTSANSNKLLQSAQEYVAEDDLKSTSQESVKKESVCDISDDIVEIDLDSNKESLQNSNKNLENDEVDSKSQDVLKETSVCDLLDSNTAVVNTSDENYVPSMDSNKELFKSLHENITEDKMKSTSQETLKEISVCNVSDDVTGVGDADMEVVTSPCKTSKEPNVCDLTNNDAENDKKLDENMKDINIVSEIHANEKFTSSKLTLLATEKSIGDKHFTSNDNTITTNSLADDNKSSEYTNKIAQCSSLVEERSTEDSGSVITEREVTDKPKTKIEDGNQSSDGVKEPSEIEKSLSVEDNHSEKTKMEVDFIDISSDTEDPGDSNLSEPLKKKRKYVECNSENKTDNMVE